MKPITTTAELAAFCNELQGQPFVAVDTEFMRETTYWPKLCLIQVGAPNVEAVIDPLADGLDMTPLLDLMRDERVLKVFHAARQDVEIFNNLGAMPRPLFDTQVAGMAAGFGEQIAYDALVRQMLKIELDKSSRFTDWARRPLSQTQMDYALGDVTARIQLTPVALGEAMVVVDHLFGAAAGKKPRHMSYDFIPTAVFTHPNIGTVGYSEADARKEFGKVSIYRSEFKALKHTLSGSTERTLMKLVVDDASDRVVGLHMVGADAGEVVQGFAVAMKAGATKAIFDSTIGIHPTAAEEFVTMREPVKEPARAP